MLTLGTFVQGCSSSRSGEEGGGAWSPWGIGNRPAESSQAAAQPRDEWRQPRGFDADGPTSAPRNTYRGGRDPVTGRAAQWPPAAPAAESATVSQLPPAAPYAMAPPPMPPAPAPSAQGYGTAHPGTASVEVRTGDTLYRIARAHNVTVPQLMQANGLASESIRVGQRLTIPGR